MNSQMVAEMLSNMLALYDYVPNRVTADDRKKNPACLTITVSQNDGTIICMSKSNELPPAMTEDQYSELLMKQGEELISRLANLIVKH